MCRSSKGGVQWEIIFYSSFIGYTFHIGCKVLCNKHVHILVQQIIPILNAISMVDWNLFLYIDNCTMFSCGSCLLSFNFESTKIMNEFLGNFFEKLSRCSG